MTGDPESSNAWRVDAAPRWGQPLLAAYGEVVGRSMEKVFHKLHHGCRIEWRGDRSLLERPHILCAWHEHWPAIFVALKRFQRHAWINHPVWYMKPVHVAMRRAGIERIHLGSTGHGGRRAADALVASLKAGYSTVICPDGPAGPRRRLRKGVLHVALQSGLPVVPLRLFGAPQVRLPTWDSKWLPLPGAELVVELRAPLPVTADGFDDIARMLSDELG